MARQPRRKRLEFATAANEKALLKARREFAKLKAEIRKSGNLTKKQEPRRDTIVSALASSPCSGIVGHGFNSLFTA